MLKLFCARIIETLKGEENKISFFSFGVRSSCTFMASSKAKRYILQVVCSLKNYQVFLFGLATCLGDVMGLLKQ